MALVQVIMFSSFHRRMACSCEGIDPPSPWRFLLSLTMANWTILGLIGFYIEPISTWNVLMSTNVAMVFISYNIEAVLGHIIK